MDDRDRKHERQVDTRGEARARKTLLEIRLAKHALERRLEPQIFGGTRETFWFLG
jgi:hypothetical protein